MAEKQHSTLTQTTQGALQVIRLRMTVALLRRAIADKNADSDLLFRVADLACQASSHRIGCRLTQSGARVFARVPFNLWKGGR